MKRKNIDTFQEIATKNSKTNISTKEEISQSIFISEEGIDENILPENTETDPLVTHEEVSSNSNIVMNTVHMIL